MSEGYDKSVTNMANLANWAAYSAKLPGDGDSTPKWVREQQAYSSTENRVFRPGVNQDIPRALNVGASMMIKPVVLEVSAYVNDVKTTEYYSLRDFDADSARMKFQLKYYGKSVRGLTTHPLYDLGRYA